MRFLPLVGLLGLALVAVSASAAPYPLEATLRVGVPLQAHGVLLIGPDAGPHVVHLQTLAPFPGANETVASAAHVRFELRSYPVAGFLGLRPPVGVPGQPDRDVRDLRNASLHVSAAGTAAQLLFERGSTDHGGSTRGTAAGCLVERPVRLDRTLFPDDPEAGDAGRVNRHPANQLVATCQATTIQTDAFRRAFLYGVDLWLRVPGSDPEFVRTGVIDEPIHPALPGVTRRVVKILYLESLDGEAVAAWDHESSLKLYAKSFLLTGHLSVGAGEGRLAWGPLELEGPTPSFKATGAFTLAWAPDGAIGLAGTALDGPPTLAPSSALVSSRGVPDWLAGATLVAGALGLIVYAAWILYSRLPADRVLEHPRRAQLLQLVRLEPGLPLGTLARSLRCPRTNAIHHALQLRRAGHVAFHRVGGRVVLVPTGAGLRGREEAVAYLRRPTLARVHEALRGSPGLDQKGLAKLLGVTQQRASQCLRLLGRVGLVEPANPGQRPRRYRATEGVLQPGLGSQAK